MHPEQETDYRQLLIKEIDNLRRENVILKQNEYDERYYAEKYKIEKEQMKHKFRSSQFDYESKEREVLYMRRQQGFMDNELSELRQSFDTQVQYIEVLESK